MTTPYQLATYDGQTPPAPEWFRDAVNTPYRSHSIEIDGANIAYQQWGNPENPGLLLVHGAGAHAHWYDFIAPHFIDDFNIVAIDFSGMGDSDWRSSYTLEQYAAEQIGVMRHSGMLDHEIKPIIAAHSFGGIVTIMMAAQYGELLKGVAIMDTTITSPDKVPKQPAPSAHSVNKLYADVTSALSRFRLVPSQPCDNHYILDHVAKHGLKAEQRDEAEGWTWKADPLFWGKISWPHGTHWEALPNLACKIEWMRGTNSVLLPDEVRDPLIEYLDTPFPSIDGAGHHIFLDKPLEVIDILKGFFSQWG